MPTIPLRERTVDVGGRRMVLREYHQSHLDLIRIKWFCIGFACGLGPVLPIIFAVFGN